MFLHLQCSAEFAGFPVFKTVKVTLINHVWECIFCSGLLLLLLFFFILLLLLFVGLTDAVI